MRACALLTLLIGSIAAAQAMDRDLCLAPIAPPTLKEVSAAWTAGLSGRNAAKKIPVPNHPCIRRNEVRPADQATIIGCTPHTTRTLVSVGQCGDHPRSIDGTIPCGAAVFDFGANRFIAFIPSHPGRHADQRFAGQAVVNLWDDGGELRFGARFERKQPLGKARYLDVLPDGRTVLLAIDSGKGERLAAVAPGEKASRFLSTPTREIAQLWPIGDTSLVRAVLYDEVGPPRLLFADAHSGRPIFEVTGATRDSLAPDASRLFTTGDLPKGEGRSRLVHTLTTQDGKVSRVPSGLKYTSAIGFAVDWRNQRAAVGTAASVELLSLEPLARVRTLHPFGEEKDGPQLQRLAWSPGGAVLLAYGVQQLTDQRLRHVVVVMDADGKVLRRLEQALPDTTDRTTELVVHQGEKTQRITETGELEDFVLPPYPRDECYGKATEKIAAAAIEVRGIVLPRPRPRREK